MVLFLSSLFFLQNCCIDLRSESPSQLADVGVVQEPVARTAEGNCKLGIFGTLICGRQPIDGYSARTWGYEEIEAFKAGL